MDKDDKNTLCRRIVEGAGVPVTEALPKLREIVRWWHGGVPRRP